MCGAQPPTGGVRSIGQSAIQKNARSALTPYLAEAKDRRDLRVETLECVVATALDELPRTRVERDRLPVIQHVVTGLHQQPIAIRTRDPIDAHRAQLVEVRRDNVEALAGVEIGLGAHVVAQRL